MKKSLLAPSILASDFSQLKEALAFIETNGGDLVHIDVMDGCFVPPITIGQQAVRSLRPLSRLPFDVHLMTVHPENHVDSFAEAGADWITFHYEATVHSHRLISHIHGLGKKAGLSIVPGTAVETVAPLLPFVDLLLVMTVNPGFGGQEMIGECVKKVAVLDQLRKKNGYNYLISVDGGVNSETRVQVIEAGADILVSGSAFFGGSLTRAMCCV